MVTSERMAGPRSGVNFITPKDALNNFLMIQLDRKGLLRPQTRQSTRLSYQHPRNAAAVFHMTMYTTVVADNR